MKLLEACELSLQIIDGLADQQAMADTWWKDGTESIRAVVAQAQQSNAAVDELSVAITTAKLDLKRRFLTYEEILEVIQSLGYSKS